MTTLARCYERAAELLGNGAEPFSVVESVENHRRFWRPERVRVVLLAESHVYTRPEECRPMHGHPQASIPGSPGSFVRLVYCLGYGEPDFVGGDVGTNYGTPQYWKIFSSCVNPPSELRHFGALLKTTTPHFQDRLKAKIQLLMSLREAGVWLLDASVLALYSPGGGKPSPRTRRSILKTCWDEYIGPQIAAARPDSLIVIGKGVADSLTGRLDELSRGKHIVLNQPQARMTSSALEKTHQAYYDVCHRGVSHSRAPE